MLAIQESESFEASDSSFIIQQSQTDASIKLQSIKNSVETDIMLS